VYSIGEELLSEDLLFLSADLFVGEHVLEVQSSQEVRERDEGHLELVNERDEACAVPLLQFLDE